MIRQGDGAQANYRRSETLPAMGEKDEPRVIELLSSMSSHPDIDFRRYAREAIESINLQQMKQNTTKSRTPVEKTE